MASRPMAASSAAQRSAAEVRERFTRGGLWVSILVMSVWPVVASLPLIVVVWMSHGFVSSGAPTWVTYAVVGCVGATCSLRASQPGPGRGRDGWRSAARPWALCAVLLAGALVNELTIPGGFFGRGGYGFTTAAWFALVALWWRPVTELLAFVAANGAIGLLALALLHETGRVQLAMFLVGWCGSSVFQITIYVGSRAVAVIAGQAAEAEDAAARTRNARRAAEDIQAARRARYDMIRATVARHLDGLAAGTLDLADTRTRQEIALAVTRLRRHLVENDDVPDPLAHELRACADAAERRGVAVDLIAAAGIVPALGVEVRRALLEPVIHVLALTASRARITVVASAAEVTVAIVADTTPAPAGAGSAAGRLPVGRTAGPADSVECECDEGGDRLWAQARWTRSSASLS